MPIMTRQRFLIFVAAVAAALVSSVQAQCVCGDYPALEDPGTPAPDLNFTYVATNSSYYEEVLERGLTWNAAMTDYRLPKALVPFHYDLEMQPFLIPGNFTFDGEATVWFTCLESTSNITLHTFNLTIHEATLLSSDGQILPLVQNITFDVFRYFLVIELKEELEEGANYGVNIVYSGELMNATESFRGFVYATYTAEETETRYIAVTHFEPLSARSAFPCFDEPALKATFNITLVRPENMTSIANMPLMESTVREDGWIADRFHKSVKMSTYTVAFAVTDYEYTQDRAGDILVRVWARKEKINETEMAVRLAPKFLTFFEQYLNVSYPLPKLDIIGIPSVQFGAMENWGLVTFNEAILLYDSEKHSSPRLRILVSFLAHEVAHQWFGNLVTMTWWNDIWLNEGFSTYMEHLAHIHVMHPDNPLAAHEHIITNILPMMVGSDGEKHPLSFGDLLLHQIPRVFTTIVYHRGAAVARMMDLTFGTENFNTALMNYLNYHQYNHAEQDDLWKHLGEIVKDEHGIDVKSIMDTWTLQKGFPIVTVTRNYTHNLAYIRQQPYTDDSDLKDNLTEYGEYLKWEIPLTFTSASNRNFDDLHPRKWLRQTEDYVILAAEDGIPPADEWIIFNLQIASYYHVNYDTRNWKLLIQQLYKDHTKIPYLHRAYILSSLSWFMRTGLVSPQVALSAIEYLEHESGELVVVSGFMMLLQVEQLLRPTSHHDSYRQFAQPLYRTMWLKFVTPDMNWNKLSYELRQTLIPQSCGNNVPECLQQATQFLHLLQQRNYTEIHKMGITDSAGSYTLLCSALQASASESDWEFIWKLYLQASRGTSVLKEHGVIIHTSELRWSLACTDKLSLINRYLSKSLNFQSNSLSKWEAIEIIRNVAESDYYHKRVAFDFVSQNWDLYLKRVNNSVDILDIFASKVASRQEINQIKQLVSCMPLDILAENAKDILRMYKKCERFLSEREMQLPPLVHWLEKVARRREQSP